MVVGMQLYSQIREAYMSGESQRSIAHRLEVSRQTVKKYCEGQTMPGVRKEYTRTPSVGNGIIDVSQGKFKLTAKLIKKQDNPLYAPVRGGMKRLIRESLSCTANYSFEEDGKTLFDFNIDRASFEYEFEN